MLMFGKKKAVEKKSNSQAILTARTTLATEYPFLIEAEQLKKLSETECEAILKNQQQVDQALASLLGLPLEYMRLEFLKNFSDLYEKMDKNDKAAKSKLCNTLCIGGFAHKVSEKIDFLKILSIAYGITEEFENIEQIGQAFVLMARIGNLKALRKCRENKFNICDQTKIQAATAAAASGQLKCMKYLLHGPYWEIVVNAEDNILYVAAHEGQLECVKYLIDGCLMPKEKISEAMKKASERGHLEIATYLLNYCEHFGNEKKEKDNSNDAIFREKNANMPLILSKNDDANIMGAAEKKEGEDNSNDENSGNEKKRNSLFY